MLSISPLSNGPNYYLELANISYYAEGGEPLPLWGGTAAKVMGLSGTAERVHVERLCAGFSHLDPDEKLVRNAGKDTRNPGHDLTFSCPKSVSIAWAMGDFELRKGIEAKQLAAVREAIAFIEDKAGQARIGKAGLESVKAPLLFALFEHGTSRAMDPQLHTHALLINLTVHADGRTTAVDSTHFYHWKMAAGAIYRAALARGMQELGLEVQQKTCGSSIGFELRCITSPIVEYFSKRRAEIEEQLRIKAGSLDAASPKFAEMITKETRRTKSTELSRAQLLDGWQATGREFGIDAKFLNDQRRPFQKLTPQELDRRKQVITREALDSLSSQNSHWSEAEFAKALAERSAGRISGRDARELLENKIHSPELVHLGGLQTERRNHNFNRFIDRREERYTTPEILAQERQMLGRVERIVRGPRDESRKEFVEEAIRNRPTIAPEQADAVRYLTSGPKIRMMTGLAGTGKTFSMKTCFEVWNREKRDVWGTALSAAAAGRLEKESGIKSRSLDGLLYRLERGDIQLNSRSVVLVDEAGMVGTNHLARLMEHVEEAKSRLILVGDARQLQPIGAGGPFKYLSEVLSEYRLGTIRRQDEPWMREAVGHLERGKAREAITAFIEHKRFHLSESRSEAMARLLDQWKADGGIKNPTRVLMLASYNHEVKELNLQAQAARIAAGEVTSERKIYANGVFFHVGDRLQFRQNSGVMQVANSDNATVLDVDEGRSRLTVRLDKDQREVSVDLKKYSPNNLSLAYASTTHKAQGASIPHAHVLLGGPMTDLHMGYVQASRGVISSHLFVDKPTAGGPGLSDLIRSLGQLRQKTVAHEVIRQDQEQQRKRERGISLGM